MLAALAERLELEVGAARVADRILLDSFDSRLRSAGLRAERPAGRSAGSALTLLEPGAPVRRAKVERARAPPRRTSSRAGPVRERLAGVLEERALLPIVRVRSSAAVAGGASTATPRRSCGWTIERPEAVAGAGERVAAGAAAVGAPVLGYDRRATSARCAVLRDRLGLEPGGAVAVRRGGARDRRPAGGRLRPSRDVELAAGTRADAAAGIVLDAAARDRRGQRAGHARGPRHASSCTTCASRSAARARCCASSSGVHDPDERQRRPRRAEVGAALTGPVRDLDVQLLEWEDLTALLPPERAAELEPLRALLARRRARELRKLQRRACAARASRRALRAGARSRPPGRPRTERGRRGADRGGRRRSGSARSTAAWSATAARSTTTARPRRCTTCASAARSCATCSSCSAARSRARWSSRCVSTLKDLQDVLGRFQDRAVQVEMLRDLRDELAAEPGGPAALIALGPALDALLADQEAARAEFADALRGASPARGSAARARRASRSAVRVKIVATYSIKGGVGKTSAAVNLGALAAARRPADADLGPRPAGRRVVPAPGRGRRSRAAARRLIRGKREPIDVMKGTDIEGLDLLPGRLLLPPPRHPARPAQEARWRGCGACSRSSRTTTTWRSSTARPRSRSSRRACSAPPTCCSCRSSRRRCRCARSSSCARFLTAASRRRRRCSPSSRWSTAARACTRS